MVELTATEQVIMKCLWDLGGNASVADLLNCLEERYNKRYARTTISVFMSYLRDKGYVSYEKKSHAYVYKPLVSEEVYRCERLMNYQKTGFDGSAVDMLETILNNSALSGDDCRRLIRLLEEKEKQAMK